MGGIKNIYDAVTDPYAHAATDLNVHAPFMQPTTTGLGNPIVFDVQTEQRVFSL